MIQRFDQLAVDLPEPGGPNPAAAAAVQELMGGKFGEMSTLMNYTFQARYCGSGQNVIAPRDRLAVASR